MNWSRRRLATVLYFLVVAPVTLVVLSALPQHAAPQTPASEIVLGIDPSQSKVHWTLGSTVHTVHGSFAFKKGNLQLDTSTGKASGEIVVDATSGNSGNDGRDKKMHKEVLESLRYAEVIFRPDRVNGEITRSGRKMTSAYRKLSRTSLCIFLSRPSLPLFPLVASTTISPLAFPVEVSSCRFPFLNAKDPWTVWTVLPSVQCTLL